MRSLMKSKTYFRNSADQLSIEEIRKSMGLPGLRARNFLESLPFSANDITAGSENELQAAVTGKKCDVDLAITIETSNYFGNIIKRVTTGDSSRKVMTGLENYLETNSSNVWENSWVRFPLDCLGDFSKSVLNADLLANRNNPMGAKRSDCDKFFCEHEASRFVRAPISYLIKLALADVIGCETNPDNVFSETGKKMMEHFLSDNTSPETFSFHVVRSRPGSSIGNLLANETLRRNTVTQLLISYANKKFRLEEFGQSASVYFSPHPPVRQRQLNDCISDSFYRELFMSPCLSGWDDGETKHSYMGLCHQMMSRSQLNAVAKMREAGIITRNLVVLPTVSNISLANNGAHISLGSVKLTSYYGQIKTNSGNPAEKLLGDLAIKIIEHFLPLFVGTYSAAPYRIDYSEFHPERVLGFLPHELDYTHLRMLWRRWKKKASISVFGQPVTPFGIKRLDNAVSSAFRAKGDFIPDFRLIDYLVSLMSTDRSPALDGKTGNDERLKRDLEHLGVFDRRMSLYLLYRLREISRYGYSGFEGRHYSLFENISDDMAQATNLQAVITAMAFKYIFEGRINHNRIPDDPFIESERRQIFFCVAIGIPTFYVKENTSNQFLAELVKKTGYLRYSRRYSGYIRVLTSEYLKALHRTILDEGAEIIEMMNIRDQIDELELRLESPQRHSALGKITNGILTELGTANPLNSSASEFNQAAENYYRNTLRKKCLREGLDRAQAEMAALDSRSDQLDPRIKTALTALAAEISPIQFLSAVKEQAINERISLNDLRKLINLIVLLETNDVYESQNKFTMDGNRENAGKSIHSKKYGTS